MAASGAAPLDLLRANVGAPVRVLLRDSALDGVRPEDLTIDALVGRVEAGGIDEVVLAMNATLEGQTTAHYLAERLERFPIRLTQLAHGVPVGGELDYLDEGTLAQALRARRPECP